VLHAELITKRFLICGYLHRRLRKLAIEIEKAENTLVGVEPTELQVLAHYHKFQFLKEKILKQKEHFIMINDKVYIKRSGWQAIALAFNISTRIVEEQREEKEKSFGYRILVEAKANNGRTAIGDGACFSNERAFAHLEHDVHAVAVTRATNRAISNIVGSGEVTADEIQEDKK